MIILADLTAAAKATVLASKPNACKSSKSRSTLLSSQARGTGPAYNVNSLMGQYIFRNLQG